MNTADLAARLDLSSCMDGDLCAIVHNQNPNACGEYVYRSRQPVVYEFLAALSASQTGKAFATDVVSRLDAEAASTLYGFLTPSEGDDDSPETTLHVGDGHSGRGIYISLTEYPEEGSVFIAACQSRPAAASQTGVPREPTEAMLDRGAMEIAMLQQRVQTAEHSAGQVWRAMYDAAPSQPEARQEGLREALAELVALKDLKVKAAWEAARAAIARHPKREAVKHAREDYNRIQDPAGKIGADEPVFLNNLHHGDPVLTALAEQQADAMEAWQANHGAKPADAALTRQPAPEAAQQNALAEIKRHAQRLLDEPQKWNQSSTLTRIICLCLGDEPWTGSQMKAEAAQPALTVTGIPTTGLAAQPAQAVAWRHSDTHSLHDTEDEVQLADGDSWPEPLYLAPPATSEDRRDAERYRWLRAWFIDEDATPIYALTLVQVDAHVDAAMDASTEQGGEHA